MNSPHFNFYVHIIESPAPSDLLNGLTEGRMLCSFLELAQIPCLYNLAVDYEQFNESMTDRIACGVQQFDLPPVLHFSMHGNEHGIQLTNQRQAGEMILWQQLAAHIKPINQAMGGALGVCMSTCAGAHGRAMARVLASDQVPMGWLVGSSSSVSFCDAALAFCVLYRGLQRGDGLDGLVEAARKSSGIADFDLEFGHVIHEQFSQRMRDALKQLGQNLRARRNQRDGTT